MLYKRIFGLILCSTILTPVYGMEDIKDESKPAPHTAPKPSKTVSTFPTELTNNEILQLFFEKVIQTSEGFRISLKEDSPSQSLKNKALLLRAEEFDINAVGEINLDMGSSNTMAIGQNNAMNQGCFVKYKFYAGEEPIPQCEFLTSVSKENTSQISPKETTRTFVEDFMSTTKSFPLKKEAPGYFAQESAYLNYVVNLFLDLQQPANASLKDFEKTMMLLYSYPTFTTEKNLFSLLNIIKEEYPKKEYLSLIISLLHNLQDKALPNGLENLKEAENELNELSQPINLNNIKITEDDEYIKYFNEEVQRLKNNLLGKNIETKENQKKEERQHVLDLIKSQESIPLDGMNLDSEKFIEAIFRRDWALSRVPLKDFMKTGNEVYQDLGSQAAQTAYWVAVQALSLPNIEHRKELYSIFFDLYKAFLNRGNFHGAYQIASGIAQPALWRVIEEDMNLRGKDKPADNLSRALKTMQAFADPAQDFDGYHGLENWYFNKHHGHPWPYFGVFAKKIEKHAEEFSKLTMNLQTPEGKASKRSIIQETAELLKLTSNYPSTLSEPFPDETYLKAVCNFKIYPETLIVYSDLIYPWESRRKLMVSTYERKALEDWDPEDLAHLLRTNMSEHSIRICFDNNVCSGKDIINWLEVKKRDLKELGGRRGLSPEMIERITSAPRKVKGEWKIIVKDGVVIKEIKDGVVIKESKKSSRNKSEVRDDTATTTTPTTTTVEEKSNRIRSNSINNSEVKDETATTKVEEKVNRIRSNAIKTKNQANEDLSALKKNRVTSPRRTSAEKSNTIEVTSTKPEEKDSEKKTISRKSAVKQNIHKIVENPERKIEAEEESPIGPLSDTSHKKTGSLRPLWGLTMTPLGDAFRISETFCRAVSPTHVNY